MQHQSRRRAIYRCMEGRWLEHWHEPGNLAPTSRLAGAFYSALTHDSRPAFKFPD